MQKIILNSVFYLILIMILYCEKNESPLISKNMIDSPILFAQCYTNYAWGYQYSGWYVDIEGQIYEVDINADIKLENIKQDSSFSEKLLVNLLKSSKKTTKYLNKEVLLKMKNLIIPSSFGQLTEPIDICEDFGIISYFTFIRDQKNNGYRSILLIQAGDWAQKNLSPEAKELFELLRLHVENDTTKLPCAL